MYLQVEKCKGNKNRTGANFVTENRSVQGKSRFEGSPTLRGWERQQATQKGSMALQLVEAPNEARKIGKQNGKFLGDPSTFHIHFVSGEAHYKYGHVESSRQELTFHAKYTEARLRKALEKINAAPEDAKKGGKQAYTTCIDFINDQIARLTQTQQGAEEEEEKQQEMQPVKIQQPYDTKNLQEDWDEKEDFI